MRKISSKVVAEPRTVSRRDEHDVREESEVEEEGPKSSTQITTNSKSIRASYVLPPIKNPLSNATNALEMTDE